MLGPLFLNVKKKQITYFLSCQKLQGDKYDCVLRYLPCDLLSTMSMPVAIFTLFRRRLMSNLVPRVFSLSNMAAAGEKTLAHSELKRSLIGAFHGTFIRALSLVYFFQNKDGYYLRASWAEKCFLQCLRPKRWTEFRSDCSENSDLTVGRQRFEDSDI